MFNLKKHRNLLPLPARISKTPGRAAGVTECGEPFGDGGQDVHDHVGLQAGDEVHVVLGENFQQGIVGLAELGIILREKEEKSQF